MWKSHRGSGTSGKSLKAGVILAHNAQRRNRTSHKMQSLSGARQNLSLPIRATDVSYKPLAFSAVGIGHIRTSTHGKGPMQIYRCSSGLFHQMGRNRALGYYHRTKGTYLRLVCHNMQVWYPESPSVRQWDNPKFRDFCTELGIKNYYSSPAHPQSNGQAEVTIRILKATLKTKLEGLKGKWVEYLP